MLGRHISKVFLVHLRKIMLSRSRSSICVVPGEALVDEPVVISISGLLPNQSVTIHARLVESGLRLSSYGHFTCTSEGTLNLCQHASHSGTYKGIEPMGLFWSMVIEPGQRPGRRLMKRDVTTPYDITLSVIDGHVSMENLLSGRIDTLCQEHVLRWYKDKSVKRKEVRHGNIRGTMFIPPGKGPHPAIIDMFGTAGGLFEYKASLLASRGFVTLALAWFAFEDLPKSFEGVIFEYFVDAVQWLNSQPEVYPSRIGAVGVSKGSDFALMMGMYCPEVKAVVSVGGTPFPMFADLPYGNLLFPGVKLENFKYGEDSDSDSAKVKWIEYDDSHLFDYSKMTAKVLFLLGDDDGTLPVGVQDPALCKLTSSERRKFTSIIYSKTGHLIEPPYSPICTVSFHKHAGRMLYWGGDIPYHAKAQEDSWRKILTFFREHLNNASSVTTAKL